MGSILYVNTFMYVYLCEIEPVYLMTLLLAKMNDSEYNEFNGS